MLFLASSWPSRLHLPAPLPSARFCCPGLSRRLPLRYYEGSDSCPPRPRPAGLSAYSASPSRRPVLKHVVRPNVAFAVASARPVDALASARLRHASAGSPQTPRRNRFVILRATLSPPVAPHPASRQRSYLWLHVLRLHIAGTLTLLTKRPHGRTHAAGTAALRLSRIDLAASEGIPLNCPTRPRWR